MKSPHILCLPVLLAAAVTSMAQPASGPQPVSGMSYTKYKNKLYIYGGWDGIRLGVNTELFVLDLSKSWTSESPSWYRLPAGPAMTDSTSAMSPDGQTLILIPSKEGETFRFSVSSHSWVRSSAIFRNTTMGASPVLLEPNGKVLVVGGRSATFNKPFDDQYDLYSFNNDKLETARLPEFLEGKKVRFAPNSKGYRSVWSRYLKKALLYGGEYDKVLSDYLISDTVSMYDPVTAQWSEMKTLDFTINSVSDHCMATTEDGKKLIVYGGYVLMNGTQVDNYSLRMLDLVKQLVLQAKSSMSASRRHLYTS
ncbi:hypothetical protein BGZ73_006552 [Actinomortierella ambigua]|nr:hypothetical protein BGZ73_006552 [Actinomortierella ambigua]